MGVMIDRGVGQIVHGHERDIEEGFAKRQDDDLLPPAFHLVDQIVVLDRHGFSTAGNHLGDFRHRFSLSLIRLQRLWPSRPGNYPGAEFQVRSLAIPRSSRDAAVLPTASPHAHWASRFQSGPATGRSEGSAEAA